MNITNLEITPKNYNLLRLAIDKYPLEVIEVKKYMAKTTCVIGGP